MAAPYSYSNQAQRLRKVFETNRIPESVVKEASALLARTAAMGPNVFGEERRRVIPLDLATGGNVGTNLALVDTQPAVPDTASILIQPGWIAARADADVMDVYLQENSGATNDGESIQARANRFAMIEMQRTESFFGYQDSRRRIARLATGGIAGATFIVRNPRCLHILAAPFGGVGTGDVIVMENGTTGLLEPGQAAVTRKNLETGVCTIDQTVAVAFPTVTALLAGGTPIYVKRKVDSGANRPFYGIQDQIKLRDSQVTASTLGLPTSTDPRLAGIRVLIVPGEPVRSQHTKIVRALRNVSEGGKPDMLIVTPDVGARLEAELMGGWSAIMPNYAIKGEGNVMLGFKGYAIQMPWGVCEVHVDDWLMDIEANVVGGESDELWLFTKRADHKMSTVKPLGPFSKWEEDYVRNLGGEVKGKTIGKIGQRYMTNPVNSGFCSPFARN